MIIPSQLPDIPRLYTALAESLACLLLLWAYRPLSRKGSWWLIALLMGLGQIVLQSWAGSLPLTWWLLGMGVNLVWMLISIHLLGQPLRPSQSLYLGIKAFILSEFLAATAWQIYCLLGYHPEWRGLPETFSQLCLFIGLGFLWFRLESRTSRTLALSLIHRHNLWSYLVTAGLVFLISNIGFLLAPTAYHLGNSLAIFTIRILVDAGGLLLLHLQQLELVDQHQKNELHLVQNAFLSQYQQYKAYAENTHFISQVAHNLKHQLDILLLEEDADKRQAYVADMQAALATLHTKIETGNPVLDTLLSRKKLYCQEHHINFSCIANGHLLDHLSVMDICSLIGNLLDNAIEYVETIPDIEQRLISMKLTSRGQMTILRIENYCPTDLGDLSHIPATTKDDKALHGFGLKNIAAIAKKYGGSMSLDQEDGWFAATVVFPAVEI